jgi:hypothetical protein
MQNTTFDASNIRILQNNFYANVNKNIIFKTTQKDLCAKYVEQQFDIKLLLEKTIFAIPNTNRVFFDYVLFKTYGNSNNFNIIVDYILCMFSDSINKYGNFECHINMQGFTITAAQRYKELICLFCQKCLQHNTQFARCLNFLYIYNPPSVISSISTLFSPFIDDVVKSKIILKSKGESINTISKIEVKTT